MRTIRTYWRAFSRSLMIVAFGIILAILSSWFSVQFIKGWKAYEVRNHRVCWAWVVRLPGYEQCYNHYTGGIESHWSSYARYRISPWFDAGQSVAPINNKIPDDRLSKP